jgi:hypothetical protein
MGRSGWWAGCPHPAETWQSRLDSGWITSSGRMPLLFHEGRVKVEAASSRLPSMHPREDAAATLPQRCSECGILAAARGHAAYSMGQAFGST